MENNDLYINIINALDSLYLYNDRTISDEYNKAFSAFVEFHLNKKGYLTFKELDNIFKILEFMRWLNMNLTIEELLRIEIQKLLNENVDYMETIEKKDKQIQTLKRRIRELEYLYYNKLGGWLIWQNMKLVHT